MPGTPSPVRCLWHRAGPAQSNIHAALLVRPDVLHQPEVRFCSSTRFGVARIHRTFCQGLLQFLDSKTRQDPQEPSHLRFLKFLMKRPRHGACAPHCHSRNRTPTESIPVHILLKGVVLSDWAYGGCWWFCLLPAMPYQATMAAMKSMQQNRSAAKTALHIQSHLQLLPSRDQLPRVTKPW